MTNTNIFFYCNIDRHRHDYRRILREPASVCVQPRDNEVSALIYYKVHYKQLFIVSACLLIRRLDSYCMLVRVGGFKTLITNLYFE